MRLRIYHKVFLALLVTSGVSMIVLVLAFRWSLNRGFMAYLNQLDLERQDALVDLLQDWVARNGDWQGLRENRRVWHQLLLASQGNADPGGIQRNEPIPGRLPPPPAGHRPERPIEAGGPGPSQAQQPPVMGAAPRLTVYDQHHARVIGPSPWDAEQTKKEIIVNGVVKGWLGVRPFLQVTENQDLVFLRQQTRFILLCFAGLVILAILVAAWLARHFNAPIAQLAQASRQMTQGHFACRVTPQSEDEIGQLARDFDQLARVLEKNRHARQRWFADISHELRTPLTILRGELDAIEDGIRPMDGKTVTSIRQEVDRLSKMVNDLYELSLSDLGALDYHMTPLNLVDVLRDSLDAYLPRARELGIDVEARGVDGVQEIVADAGRLHQLFDNVLENSLRYTQSPGKLRCSLVCDVASVAIDFEDSPPGVPAAQCHKLFQRLYRVEESRSRKHGGAGLGLAICRNIVEAHGGSIEAQPSDLGGLKIAIRLPRRGRSF